MSPPALCPNLVLARETPRGAGPVSRAAGLSPPASRGAVGCLDAESKDPAPARGPPRGSVRFRCVQHGSTKTWPPESGLRAHLTVVPHPPRPLPPTFTHPRCRSAPPRPRARPSLDRARAAARASSRRPRCSCAPRCHRPPTSAPPNPLRPRRLLAWCDGACLHGSNPRGALAPSLHSWTEKRTHAHVHVHAHVM